MSVGISSNVNNVQSNHQVCERTTFPQNTQNVIRSAKEDSLVQKQMFSENLTKKTNLFKGTSAMEGEVNGKQVYLTSKYNKTGLLSGYTNYKGMLGDDKADIDVKSSGSIFSLKSEINGQIGNKEVNITISRGSFGKYSVTGKIGDKEINITKGSSLEEAQGEQDILTTAASLSGLKFNLKDGNFGTLGHSKQAQDEAIYISMHG